MVSGKTAKYSKAEMKQVVASVPQKAGESKEDYAYRRDTKILKMKGLRKEADARLTQRKIDMGKKAVWRTPEGKIIDTKGTAPYGMSKKVAKERGFIELKTTGIKETEKGYDIKYLEATAPEIPKDKKVSPKAIDAVPVAIPIKDKGVGYTKDPKYFYALPKKEMGFSQMPVETKTGVVPMSTLMGYSATEPYKLLTPEEQRKILVDRKLKEDARKKQAIKVGKDVFKKMKKDGVLQEFSGLVASSMRPWSTEVAGMRYAESAGSVPKGSANLLLYQRMGEEIIEMRKEGKMKMGDLKVEFSPWGVPSFSGTGYIGKLLEAPSSVTGSVLTGIGTGSFLSGLSGSVKARTIPIVKHIPYAKNIFDAGMAIAGITYVWDTALGIWKARHIEKDEPEMWRRAVLASGEIGGLGIGALAVEGQTFTGKKIDVNPTGALKYKKLESVKEKPKASLSKPSKMRGEVETVETSLKDKPDINVHEGKFNVDFKTPEGKNINIKMDFKGTTNPKGISQGVITIPEQTVGGVKIKPQTTALESADVNTIVNWGKSKKVTAPKTETLIDAGTGKRIEIDLGKQVEYIQPYTKKGTTLERKITFTENEALKLDLKKKMQKINQQSKDFVDYYISGGRVGKKRLTPAEIPTRKELLEGYDISTGESRIGYEEAGIVRKAKGSKVKKTYVGGRTQEGMVYYIREKAFAGDKSVIDKTFENLNKHMKDVYRTASEPKKATIIKPSRAKTILQKPMNKVDAIYRETISALTKKKRGQVSQVQPPSSAIAKTVSKMKVEVSKKPSSIVDTIYKDTVANLNQKVSGRKTTLTKASQRGSLETIMRNMRDSMKGVLDTTKKRGLVKSDKKPIDVFKGREIILKGRGDIIPREKTGELIKIDDTYDKIIKYIEDTKPPPPPRPPKPRPPEAKPKPKPPEKITRGSPLIGIPGAPLGLELGYSMDSHYRVLTDHTRHKLATIEEILGM